MIKFYNLQGPPGNPGPRGPPGTKGDEVRFLVLNNLLKLS